MLIYFPFYDLFLQEVCTFHAYLYCSPKVVKITMSECTKNEKNFIRNVNNEY